MKRYLIVLIVPAVIVAGYLVSKNQTGLTPVSTYNTLTSKPPVTSTPPKEVNIKATFKVITANITRNFSNSKYHNKSEDVFIQASDPSTVHVKKDVLTWADFFNTLPMKLTKECLITGDGEFFCDSNDGTLKFYLNNVEDKGLLDKEIKEGDSILIKFTSK